MQTHNNDFCFYKIYNILWGPYPYSDDIVRFIENKNVELFVDLTRDEECAPYNTHKKYINYPIKDNNIPSDLISFVEFVNELCIKIFNYVKTKKNIYIHCKSGKNRSGMLIVILNCIINNWTVDISKKCIKDLVNLKSQYVKDIPYIKCQNNFIYSLFKPKKIYGILSLDYPHCIEFNNLKFKNHLDLKEYCDKYDIKNFYDIILNYKYDTFPLFKKMLKENCFRIFFDDDNTYVYYFSIFRKTKIKNPYF